MNLCQFFHKVFYSVWWIILCRGMGHGCTWNENIEVINSMGIKEARYKKYEW